MVDAETAARRLGVKRETLYAYVSRGLVTSHRGGDVRTSLFDLDEIERVAARSRGAREIETRLQTVTTAITEITDEGPRYRGRLATELVRTTGFEEVAEALWEAPVRTWDAVELAVPPVATDRDRIRLAVVLAGAADPLRADTRVEAVTQAAARLIASVVAALPETGILATRGSGTDGRTDAAPAGIASLLASRIGASQPTVSLEAALEAALVLLADHELAVSSVAVRVAASTRASVYDAVLAGLGCNGPLHVGASEPAYGLLLETVTRGAGPAVDEALRFGGRLPGFGHAVYADRDPRFDALLPFIADVSLSVAAAVDDLVAAAAANGLAAPNVDLGLAALALGSQARRDAGVTIFTVARMAGWVAHYLEELEAQPLRFRARAIYAARRDP